MNTHPMNNVSERKHIPAATWWAVGVFTLGFLLRMYACYHTYIINPDGILYIQQARAITDGKWNALVSCGLSTVSIYPFLISMLYPLTQNWLSAAIAVSLISGTALLIPVYLTFRRFFDRHISVLGLLVFAMMPFLIDMSADVMRGSVAWLFLSIGLYLVVSEIQDGKKVFLPLAAICFLLAAWARIEMGVVYALTAGYLLVARNSRKWKRFLLFLMPAMVVTVGLLAIAHLSDYPVTKVSRIDDIQGRLTAPVVEYGVLQRRLDQLEVDIFENIDHSKVDPVDLRLRFFVQKAKNQIWLVALGALLTNTYEAFHFPYFLIALVGMYGLKGRMARSPATAYMIWVAFGAFIMLYANILATWMIHNRFIAIVIFPALVLIGFGIERLVSLVHARWIPRRTIAIGTIGALIFVFGLYYAFEAREQDKYVYREIAENIRSRNPEGHYVRVAGISSPVLEWVGFYSNLEIAEWHCSRIFHLPRSPGDRFLEQVRETSVDYLLFEENLWRNKRWEIGSIENHPAFTLIGNWRHRDTGTIRLFRVLPIEPHAPSPEPRGE